MTDPDELFETIRDEAGRVLVGNEDILEGLTVALFTRGHVLLEGVPGVAKTTIANLFAQTLGLDYRRLQMTPDLLPADVTGTRIYRSGTGEFDLQKGPVFSNVVVADEINRATPKTQSALLEAMQERQVTIEGETHPLPSPFMIVATQNPIEMEGTFGLPEAQRDRFLLKLRVEIPPRALEARLLDVFDADPDAGSAGVDSVVGRADIVAAREAVEEVYVSEAVRDYVLDVVEGTRTSSDVAYGASPRAAIGLLQASKARAAIRGRDYVIPDDTKTLAERVLAHRLVLSTDAELSDVSPEVVVREVLDSVTTPDAGEGDGNATAVGDGGDPGDGPADAADAPSEESD
ncbi:AAA family ATPase [Candidatus Halobonum tyrrellensis]|uniref:MoxR-like ATPase n=1 Tax=Candidatus Halobonum tyrrellensis G22 TaxID=1324957 RepID=V4J3R6_9EURY|nr:MoxR family ATPase [Candidatus Halobonum tyrrellensis]ESP90022.1 MoxR-like ATPase [Candidatus Halobonum tyrrellensis G22]